MKRFAAIASAAILLVAAIAFGATTAFATEANVETNVYTTGNLDIAFDNTRLGSSVKVSPGTSVGKTVKIDNRAGSNPAWVWFTVTVPAPGGQPLATPDGTDTGWTILSTVTENDLCIYTLGYNTALAPGETTTAGMTQLEFAGHIDRVDGTYCWVVNGEVTPVQLTKEFNISFAAYAEEAARYTSLQAAYAAQNP